MPLVCPVCYHPVKVKPSAKEGRCARHRPKRVRRVIKVVSDLDRLLDKPDNLGGGR